MKLKKNMAFAILYFCDFDRNSRNLVLVYNKESTECSRVSNESHLDDFIFLLFFSFHFKEFFA